MIRYFCNCVFLIVAYYLFNKDSSGVSMCYNNSQYLFQYFLWYSVLNCPFWSLTPSGRLKQVIIFWWAIFLRNLCCIESYVSCFGNVKQIAQMEHKSRRLKICPTHLSGLCCLFAPGVYSVTFLLSSSVLQLNSTVFAQNKGAWHFVVLSEALVLRLLCACWVKQRHERDDRNTNAGGEFRNEGGWTSRGKDERRVVGEQPVCSVCSVFRLWWWTRCALRTFRCFLEFS